ncbi:hypothetical protein DESC_40073 [Desulfosarcina cetonica]|nr:hypothetical protein DESC_40073 [Desulfosarcina cetonica]
MNRVDAHVPGDRHHDRHQDHDCANLVHERAHDQEHDAGEDQEQRWVGDVNHGQFKQFLGDLLQDDIFGDDAGAGYGDHQGTADHARGDQQFLEIDKVDRPVDGHLHNQDQHAGNHRRLGDGEGARIDAAEEHGDDQDGEKGVFAGNEKALEVEAFKRFPAQALAVGFPPGVKGKHQHDQAPGQVTGGKETDHGLPGGERADDHDDAGRNDDAQDGSGGDQAHGKGFGILVLVHVGEDDAADGDHGGDGRTADGAENTRGDDRGDAQPTGQPGNELPGELDQTGCRLSANHDRSHEDEEWNADQ